MHVSRHLKLSTPARARLRAPNTSALVVHAGRPYLSRWHSRSPAPHPRSWCTPAWTRPPPRSCSRTSAASCHLSWTGVAWAGKAARTQTDQSSRSRSAAWSPPSRAWTSWWGLPSWGPGGSASWGAPGLWAPGLLRGLAHAWARGGCGSSAAWRPAPWLPQSSRPSKPAASPAEKLWRRPERACRPWRRAARRRPRCAGAPRRCGAARAERGTPGRACASAAPPAAASPGTAPDSGRCGTWSGTPPLSFASHRPPLCDPLVSRARLCSPVTALSQAVGFPAFLSARVLPRPGLPAALRTSARASARSSGLLCHSAQRALESSSCDSQRNVKKKKQCVKLEIKTRAKKLHFFTFCLKPFKWFVIIWCLIQRFDIKNHIKPVYLISFLNKVPLHYQQPKELWKLFSQLKFPIN